MFCFVILSDSSYEKSSGEVSGGLGERRGSVPVVSSIGRDDDSVTMEPPQTPSTPSRLAVSTLTGSFYICIAQKSKTG